jgi:hypothetical protein
MCSSGVLVVITIAGATSIIIPGSIVAAKISDIGAETGMITSGEAAIGTITDATGAGGTAANKL